MTSAARGRGRADIEVSIDRAELDAVLRAFNAAGKEASAELRDESYGIARTLAGHLRRSALDPFAPPQAALLAPTVVPRRDRLVTVQIGGSRRVGRAYRSRSTGRKVRAQAGALLWGSETGSESGVDRSGRAYSDRFVRDHNPVGYWIAPTVAAYGDEARERWWEAVELLLRRLGFTVTREGRG